MNEVWKEYKNKNTKTKIQKQKYKNKNTKTEIQKQKYENLER